MDEKKYLLNGEPISSRKLIMKAIYENPLFEDSLFCTANEAARILRGNGHRVENNTNYLPQGV